METDIENYRDFCLLCATLPKPDEFYVDIYSNAGRTQKLLHKIHKHLTIQVTENDGLPHGVCQDCISKLNICHDLVRCSEESHAKLLTLRTQWIVKNEPDAMEEDYPYSTASPDESVPSPEPTASSSRNTGVAQNISAPSSAASATTWENFQDLHINVHPMLEPASSIIIGSQIAFVYADKEEGDVKPKVNLVLINMGQGVANNRNKLAEKISRIENDVRRRSQFLQNHYKSTGNWDITPSFSCHTCRCSFFLQEEMIAHFESLHPSEVLRCIQCGEIVCGPKHVLDKHMELHKATTEDESYILLNMCTSQLDATLEFVDPEFVLVPLGDYNKRLYLKTPKILTSLGDSVVKPDMRSKILDVLTNFVDNFTMPDKWKQIECSVCEKIVPLDKMEHHIKVAHPSDKQLCCHCQMSIRKTSSMEAHIERHHSGGKNLLCVICDEQFRITGDEQPHMMSESSLPFKCPFPPCKLGFLKQSTLDTHVHNIHKSTSSRSKSQITKMKRRKKKKEKAATPPRNNYDMEKYLYQIPHNLDLSQRQLPLNFPKYKCSYPPCNKVYKLFHKLKAHIQAVHIGPVYCDICGKAYKNKLNIKDHMKFVHFPTRGAIICHICGKPYANRRSLKLHVRNVHDTKIPCDICGKEYSQKQMKEHKRIQHDGVKFQCKYCGKFLNGKVSLRRHEAIHEGIKLCCDICKPKLHFTTESIMKKHMLKHKNGEEITIPERLQPVKCPICYKEMACRSLKDHMKLKHSNARTLASLL